MALSIIYLVLSASIAAMCHYGIRNYWLASILATFLAVLISGGLIYLFGSHRDAMWPIALACSGVYSAIVSFGIGIPFHVHRSKSPGASNCCRVCGYNLTGNVSGVCPECGREIPAETRRLLKQITP